MVFKCQSDSFLKEFSTKVVSCERIEETEIIDGKKVKVDAFEVILEDTILFPEGGGQPCDHGFLNDIAVTKVIRRSDTAIHFTKKALNIGEKVKQRINWERRFDHMQHHSGQHLITAVIDNEFKFTTISWWLGEEISYIELDTPQITDEQIKLAENKINELIRQGKEVSVEVYSENTPDEKLKEARGRGLPDDHKGDIRVIKIEDVESTMCCGTHVSNLSQLQIVKLLQAERSKRKDKTFLYFSVGNRVIKMLDGCIQREQKLTSLLKSNASQHPELVDKLQKNIKALTKNLQNALKDVAILQAEKLSNMLPTPSYFSMHRTDAEPDFMNTFIRMLGNRTDILLFLTTGDDRQAGNMVLHGPEEAVVELGPKICNILGGKGAGKNNKFQAKVTNMAKRQCAEDLLKEYFK